MPAAPAVTVGPGQDERQGRRNSDPDKMALMRSLLPAKPPSRRPIRPGALVTAVALVAIAACGCHEFRSDDSFYRPAPGDDVPIIRQYAGTHSHELRSMRYVVRTPAQWAQVQLRDVEVDFDTEMLIVATLGRRTSDRYGVEVSRVWRDRGVLRVEVAVRQPAADGPIVLSSPYCVAVIPKCIFNVAGFDNGPPVRTRTWQQSAPPTGQW